MIDPVIDWSPADRPQAIALSEAQWWQRAAQLAILRLHDPADERIARLSSRQIDARQLIFALRQLLNAEQLIQAHLQELGLVAARNALERARQEYERALPNVKHMRDALMHFDEWSRGQGRGPQKTRIRNCSGHAVVGVQGLPASALCSSVAARRPFLRMVEM